MDINCPKCDRTIDVTDKLPERACDDEDYECICGCEFSFGWYALPEIRSVKSKGIENE